MDVGTLVARSMQKYRDRIAVESSEGSLTYGEIGSRIFQLARGLKSLGLDYTINQIGSMFTLFFTDKAVNNFSDAKTSDTALFGKYFKGMLDKGIYLPPSQYESWFLSAALGDSEYDQIITTSKATLRSL